MVGSVLMQRMQEDGDFNGIEPVFFTTSQVGQPGPDIGVDVPPLKDAFDIDALKALDVVVTCSKVATIPSRFIKTCVRRVGKATGLMRPAPCVWKTKRPLFWIRSIVR